MLDIKKLKPKFITDENGKKVEVILPINIFNSLIEDLQDLEEREKRKNEPVISHEDLIKELKADGLL